MTWRSVDGPGLLVRFKEIRNHDQAVALQDVYLEAEAGPTPLADDAVWWHELQGVPVATTDGEALGTVEDVFRSGGGEVLVVTGGPSRRGARAGRERASSSSSPRAMVASSSTAKPSGWDRSACAGRAAAARRAAHRAVMGRHGRRPIRPPPRTPRRRATPLTDRRRPKPTRLAG